MLWITVILATLLAVSLLSYSLSVYTTATEGAKAEYTGWEDVNGNWYPKSGTTSLTLTDGTQLTVKYEFEGTQFKIQPYDSEGQPYTALAGSMGTIALTEENPVKAYRWELPTQQGTTEVYRMELWKLRWTINVWTITKDWDRAMDWGGGTKIWIRINLNDDIWYFEDQPTEAYFGICAIVLQNFTVATGDPNQIEVYPESINELLNIEVPSGTTNPDEAFYEYQGKKLNPTMFRPYVNTWLRLDIFQPYIRKNIFGVIMEAEDASVQWKFDVYVFVVGKWIVQPEQSGDVGIHQGQVVKWANPFAFIGAWFTGLGNAIAEWFANPWNMLMFWTMVFVILIIILAVTGVLTPIVTALSSRRGRK